MSRQTCLITALLHGLHRVATEVDDTASNRRAHTARPQKNVPAPSKYLWPMLPARIRIQSRNARGVPPNAAAACELHKRCPSTGRRRQAIRL